MTAEFFSPEANVTEVTPLTVNVGAQFFMPTPVGQNDNRMSLLNTRQYLAGTNQQIIGGSDGFNIAANAILTQNIAAGQVTILELAPDAITNLTTVINANDITIENSTGTNAIIPEVSDTFLGLCTPAILAKSQQTVSVLDFGADPSGVTDSRDAITDAIQEAFTRRLSCFIPGGTYRIDSPILLQSNNSILGEPGVSILQGSGGGVGSEFQLMVRPGAECSLKIQGVTFRHNGGTSPTPNYPASSIIDLDRCVDLEIDRCEFYNAPNACIRANNVSATPPRLRVSNSFGSTDIGGLFGGKFIECPATDSLQVNNCVTNNIARGVELVPAAGFTIRNVTVMSNVFRNGRVGALGATCTPIMIYLKDGDTLDNVTVSGNTIDNCTNDQTNGYVIRMQGTLDGTRYATNVTITGNVVKGWTGGGSNHMFFIRSARNVTITGNVLDEPTWTATPEAAIYFENLLDAVIDGNVIKGSFDPACMQAVSSLGLNENVVVADNTTPEDQTVISAANANGIHVTHAGWGNPEGNVSAGVGSVFFRRDGTTDNTMYIKETGGANVGWVPFAPSRIDSRKDSYDVVGTAGTSQEVNFTTGDYDNKFFNITGPATFTSFTASTPGRYELWLKHDATGFHDVNVTVRTRPQLDTIQMDPDSNGLVVIRLYYDGATWNVG